MLNAELQKYFDIQYSAFDILRFKKRQKYFSQRRLQYGRFERPEP
jgi:hypothetical protein